MVDFLIRVDRFVKKELMFVISKAAVILVSTRGETVRMLPLK
jgi:hypothetical protein